MSIKGRKFTDLTSGKTYTVVNVFDTVAILDNKTKINISKLLDENFFSSVGGGISQNQRVNESVSYDNGSGPIDPNKFMGGNWVSNIAETAKRIDSSNLSDNGGGVVVKSDIRSGPDPSGERNSPFRKQEQTSHFPPTNNRNNNAIVANDQDPEIEKQELLRKYQNQQRQVNPSDAAKRQMETMSRFLDPEEEAVMPAVKPVVKIVEQFEQLVNDPEPNQTKQDPVVQQIPIQQTPVRQEIKVENIKTEQEDPIIVMFNKAKRSVEFKFNIEVKEFIPKPDFISLMEESYENSIIDFLSQEFTDRIMKDPEKIKEKIKGEIRSIIEKNNDVEENAN